MKLFQAFEAEYTAFRAFSREAGELCSRLTSLGFVSLQPFAIFAALAGRSAAWGAVALFLGIYITMYLVLDRRRLRLAAIHWPTDWDPTIGQRLAIVGFMSASTVGIALASRHSPGAAALIYLMTSLLPLRKWIDSIAPRAVD